MCNRKIQIKLVLSYLFRTIIDLNTNIAVKAGAGSIIFNNYLSNNDVGLGMTGEQSGCCIIDHNQTNRQPFLWNCGSRW